MLRHSGRSTIQTDSKKLGHYVLDQGHSLFDLSGGSLAQTLVFPYQGGIENISEILSFNTPSAGFESSNKLAFQADLLESLNHRFADALWANSGSDGVEIALWAANLLSVSRSGTVPETIIVREGGYHGNTQLCRSVSTRMTPLSRLDQKVKVLREHLYSSPDDAAMYTPASAAENRITLTESVRRLLAEADIPSPCVLLLEGFPTTGWKFHYEASEYQALLEFCRKNGIITVVDDVASGTYRHGRITSLISQNNKQPHPHDYAMPDIMVLSKGLTSGTYPLSCCLLSQETVQAVQDSGERPLTFTYGLTEAGAVLASSYMKRCADLFASGKLKWRSEFVQHASESNQERFHQYGIGIEATQTSLRFDLPVAMALKISAALNESGLWAYIGSSDISIQNEVSQARRFLHLCPPFDIEVEVQQNLIAEAVDILITHL